ncbi:hypothetical protein SNE40_005627 [Patella caerulea]|uniref:Toll-interacting protein n=1 Tax=Patella caerulea TaxID=87958 RepID=A0AAN8PXN9_PATCE
MASTTRSEDRRAQVMVGDLPNDFLRVSASPEGQNQQVMEDARIAQVIQAQQAGGFTMAPANAVGRLSISVVEAKLVKNYGITKMDPYCRIRIGHTVFETPTAYNGAKNPRWNKSMQTYLPTGVDSLYIEIFDERSFTMDDRIAWAHVNIPTQIMSGETADDWFPLSGRQGDEKEGTINLCLSLTPMSELQQPAINVAYNTPVMMPMFYPPVVQPGIPMTYPQQPVQQRPLYTDDDLKEFKDMFPNMDLEVIKSVLEANRGNKETTINALLTMNSD